MEKPSRTGSPCLPEPFIWSLSASSSQLTHTVVVVPEDGTSVAGIAPYDTKCGDHTTS